MSPQLSIVGETILKQAQDEALTLWASPSDTDKYVDDAETNVLICREKNRHDFPTLTELRGTPLDFIGVNVLGLFVRAPIDCRCCGEAYQEQLWEKVGKGKAARMHYVAAHTRYYPGGKYLLKPGHGRMTSKMIKESLATTATAGVSSAQLKRQALARAAEIRAAEVAEAERRAEARGAAS